MRASHIVGWSVLPPTLPLPRRGSLVAVVVGLALALAGPAFAAWLVVSAGSGGAHFASLESPTVEATAGVAVWPRERRGIVSSGSALCASNCSGRRWTTRAFPESTCGCGVYVRSFFVRRRFA